MMKKIAAALLIAGSLFFGIFELTLSRAAAAAQPNIVLIMADDMGYGDVQALNGKSKIPTPNLGIVG